MKPNLYLYALDFPDGTIYLGITKDVPTRWRYHRKFAAGTKSQTRLSVAIRQHGASNVRIRTIAYGGFDYIRDCEVRAISVYRSTELTFGHNTNPGGKAIAPEVVEKIRAANRNPSPETLAKMSAASSSRSPATIEKMRAAHLGRRDTEATRAKKIEALRRRIMTPETKAKLSALNKGRKQPASVRDAVRKYFSTLSPEEKRTRSGWVGRKHTTEAKAKMSAAQLVRPAEQNERMRRTLTGRKLSPTHRANVIAASAKRRDPVTGKYGKGISS